jgi:hypothetical protein
VGKRDEGREGGLHRVTTGNALQPSLRLEKQEDVNPCRSRFMHVLRMQPTCQFPRMHCHCLRSKVLDPGTDPLGL